MSSTLFVAVGAMAIIGSLQSGLSLNHSTMYAKSILDFAQDFQTGLTLRPLEAVYFGKKLITNNKGILEHDIYDSNNMFVLDHNDIEHIVEFLNQPFKSVSHEVLDYYDFSSWINRFGIR